MGPAIHKTTPPSFLHYPFGQTNNNMNTKGSIALIPLFIIVSLIGLITAAVSSRISSPIKTTPAPALSPTKTPPVRGLFVLSTDHEANIYSVGDVIDIMVMGDSGGFPITGFDTVVEFDPEMIEYQRTVHLQAGYQAFDRQGKTFASVTAIKKLELKEPIYFQNTPLVKFQFKALKQGVARIALKQTECHLVDENSKEILNKVSGISITVGTP